MDLQAVALGDAVGVVLHRAGVGIHIDFCRLGHVGLKQLTTPASNPRELLCLGDLRPGHALYNGLLIFHRVLATLHIYFFFCSADLRSMHSMNRAPPLLLAPGIISVLPVACHRIARATHFDCAQGLCARAPRRLRGRGAARSDHENNCAKQSEHRFLPSGPPGFRGRILRSLGYALNILLCRSVRSPSNPTSFKRSPGNTTYDCSGYER